MDRHGDRSVRLVFKTRLHECMRLMEMYSCHHVLFINVGGKAELQITTSARKT